MHKIASTLRSLSDPKIAVSNSRFFKPNTDKFLGLNVPLLRKLSKQFNSASLNEIFELLQSEYNEERLIALLILVEQYKANPDQVYQFYLNNRGRVNNWNLVDLSAYQIVGDYLKNRDRAPLLELAHSNVIWDRRIAIVSTFAFIKNSDLDWTIKIAETLLNDKEDLIHKATGWMLRELGKKNTPLLLEFLKIHSHKMPRTMYRYAIERLKLL